MEEIKNNKDRVQILEMEKGVSQIVKPIPPHVAEPNAINRQQILLPPLTQDLKKKAEQMGLLKTQKNFVQFWAAYLLSSTNQRPSKLQYQHFAQTIVEAYPILADADGGCVSIYFIIYHDMKIFLINFSYMCICISVNIDCN